MDIITPSEKKVTWGHKEGHIIMLDTFSHPFVLLELMLVLTSIYHPIFVSIRPADMMESVAVPLRGWLSVFGVIAVPAESER